MWDWNVCVVCHRKDAHRLLKWKKKNQPSDSHGYQPRSPPSQSPCPAHTDIQALKRECVGLNSSVETSNAAVNVILTQACGIFQSSLTPRKIMLFLLLYTFVCVNTLYTVLLCASARALWKSSNGSAFLSFQVTLIILTAWIYPPKTFASSEVACPFQSANVESEVLNITDWPSTLILKTLYSDIHAFMWLIHNFWHSLEMHKRRCGKLYLCNTMTRCSKHNMATI